MLHANLESCDSRWNTNPSETKELLSVCFISSEVVALLVFKMHSFSVTLHYMVIAILTKMKPVGFIGWRRVGTEGLEQKGSLDLSLCLEICGRLQSSAQWRLTNRIFIYKLKAKNDWITFVGELVCFAQALIKSQQRPMLEHYDGKHRTDTSCCVGMGFHGFHFWLSCTTPLSSHVSHLPALSLSSIYNSPYLMEKIQ